MVRRSTDRDGDGGSGEASGRFDQRMIHTW